MQRGSGYNSVLASYLIIAFISLGVGCGAVEEPSTFGTTSSALSYADLGIPCSTKTCASTRWIGIRGSGQSYCPPATRAWSHRPLFPGSAVPPALKRYCLYVNDEYVDLSHPRAYPFETLVLDGKLEAAAPDCGHAVLSTARRFGATKSTKPLALAHDILRERFRHQAGRMSPLPGSGPSAPPASQVGALTVFGAEHETETLEHLARDLLCPGGACIVQPKTEHPGTIGELAVGIARAAMRPSKTPPVLSISAGWEPEFGGASCKPPAVQAAFDALRVASCRDALLLAAQGDRRDGAVAQATSYPAAWMTVAAPDVKTCRALLGILAPWPVHGPTPGPAPGLPGLAPGPAPGLPGLAPGPAPGLPGLTPGLPGLTPGLPGLTPGRPGVVSVLAPGRAPGPLVHAVGDVQGTGKPLSTSLTGPRPLLAAYGDLSVRKVTASKYRALSGTAVAVTVVAAAATAIRYYRPGISASTVARLLRKSGDALQHDASLCPAGAAGKQCRSKPVRRVSLCRAIWRACKKNSNNHKTKGRCPATPVTCQPWDPDPPKSPLALRQFAQTYSPPVPVLPAACAGQLHHCPHRMHPGAFFRELSYPENPGDPGFMEVHGGKATLYVDRTDQLAVGNPTLVFQTGSGETYVELDNLKGSGGVYKFDSAGILDKVALVGSDVDSAMLSYEVWNIDKRSVIIPLYIFVR